MSAAPILPVRPPVVVHHMAAFDEQTVPQNSLEAIAACLERKASVIEVDVTALAADDYLLVHDPLLESETSGSGRVGQTTSEQARRLTIQVRGAATPYRVPLLGDVVRLLRAHDHPARLQLDFKNIEPFTSDEPLERLLALIEPLGERVLVSSGADWQMRKLRRMAPWLRLGFDVMGYIDWEPPGHPRHPEEYPKHLGAYGYYDDHPLALTRRWSTADYLRDRCESLMGAVPGVTTFYIRHTLLAHSLDDGFNWAGALHAHGITLDAWTLDANNPVAVANLLKLRDAGVDMFTTNTPSALAALLNK